MPDAVIPASAFRLLAELEKNNDKAWFDQHRARIRDEVQEPFAAVLDAVSEPRRVCREAPTPERKGL